MSANKANNAGNFQPLKAEGTAITEGWKSVPSVQNAHDTGNRGQYKAPLNRNTT